MIPSPDDRERLYGIENDWQQAIAAIHEERKVEATALRVQLTAIHREYRRLARRLLGVVAGLVLVVVAGFAAQAYQNGKSESAHGALCALREDLRDRARDGDGRAGRTVMVLSRNLRCP